MMLSVRVIIAIIQSWNYVVLLIDDIRIPDGPGTRDFKHDCEAKARNFLAKTQTVNIS